MPSRLGHGLYKKIDRLKNIFRCIYIIKLLCGRKDLTKVTLVQWMIQPDLHNYYVTG